MISRFSGQIATSPVRITASVAMVWLCLIVPARDALSSTLERSGTGARALGVAGAGAAASTGAQAVYDNPAALGHLDHAEALVSGASLRYLVRIDRGGGRARWPTVEPPSLTLGTAAVAVPIHPRIGVGIVLHLPLSGPSRLLSYDHRRPQLPLWQGLGERLAIAGSLGVRVTDTLSLGATAHVAADLDAKASFGVSLADGSFTQQDLDVHLRTRIVPAAAALWRPTAALHVMLRWRAAYEVTYAVPLRLDVVGVGPVAMRVSGTGLLSAEVVTLAVAWRGSLSIRWLASLRYERWSQLPPLSPTVSVVAGGQLAWLEASATPPDPGASDIVVGHVGAELRLAQSLVVRAAGGFRPTPLPRASGAASWLDSRATELAAGVSWRALPRLSIDFGVTWSHLLDRRVTKQNPADPIGFVGVSGDILHFALTFRQALGPARAGR